MIQSSNGPPIASAAQTHDLSCSCCSIGTRRAFLRSAVLFAGVAGVAAMAPRWVLAQYGQYEAMVVSCIDPRIVGKAEPYMAGRGLSGKYSQFVIAGGPIAVAAPAFADWRKTFFDNLGATIQLHSIKRVIGLTHLDCGAAKIAYGADSVTPAARELETHRAALLSFRDAVASRHPTLVVETGAMALDGSVTML